MKACELSQGSLLGLVQTQSKVISGELWQNSYVDTESSPGDVKTKELTFVPEGAYPRSASVLGGGHGGTEGLLAGQIL